MHFHSWIHLDTSNRVCRHCNRHERIASDSMQVRYIMVVREGTKGTCSIGGHLVRIWTNFRMGKQ